MGKDSDKGSKTQSSSTVGSKSGGDSKVKSVTTRSLGVRQPDKSGGSGKDK